MKFRKSMVLALALGLAAVSASAADYAKYYADMPVKINQVRDFSIPDYSVKISDFGGVNDGVTLNTKAFEDAIAHVSQ